MGFVSTLSGILGFIGIGLPLGIITCFFFFVYSKPKVIKEPTIVPITEIDRTSIQCLLLEIPNWVKSPDSERVDWLNKFMNNFWPYLNVGLCNTIRRVAQPFLDDYIGRYQIQDIQFENLSLGTLSPTFHGIKVYDTNENETVMEPTIKWAGNPNIVLVVKLIGVHIRLQLIDLQIFVTPRIHLKPLVPTFPCFASLMISLMEQPYVDFGLNIEGGDIMSIPGLYHFVQETLKKQVANLYHWPQTLEIPILDSSISLVNKPVGILHVKVVRAIKLLKKDFSGTSDPYVKLKLTGENIPSKRTSIKMKNLNPEWNEDFNLIVKNPDTQALRLHVYDWDKVGCHDSLGIQVIPLHLVTPHETKLFTLDLLKKSNFHHDEKQRGQLVVELTYEPFQDESESCKTPLRESMRKESITSRGSTIVDTSFSEAWVLAVTIIEAEDVEGMHHTNPYAQILFRGEKKKTQIMKKNHNPRWNEEFDFVVEEPPLDDKLRIEVFSKHKTIGFHRKESLGFVDISLTDAINNGRINEKYHLINSKNGIIHVEIKCQTT